MDALVVEDGSGLNNADSYVSIGMADTYCANMGYGAWVALTSDQKTAALRMATQYIDYTYTFMKGVLKVYGNGGATRQALMWPRTGVVVRGTLVTWPVPGLTAATCELALRAAQGALIADVDDAQVVEQTVGPITTKYGESRFSGQQRFPLVDRLLKELTGGSQGVMRVERA